MAAISEVQIGDLVWWHDDPANPSASAPVLGWVVEKGREAISILVFSQVAGFLEKKSVRHKDDPFWRESEMAGNWHQWGCWSLHPTTETLRELRPLLTKLRIAEARMESQKAPMDAQSNPGDEPVRRGPGRPRKVESSGVEVSE